MASSNEFKDFVLEQLNLVKVESLQQAKNLPCVFNNFAVCFKGKFETVNLLDIPYLQRILKK